MNGAELTKLRNAVEEVLSEAQDVFDLVDKDGADVEFDVLHQYTESALSSIKALDKIALEMLADSDEREKHQEIEN